MPSCPNCETIVPDGANFCHICSYPLKEARDVDILKLQLYSENSHTLEQIIIVADGFLIALLIAYFTIIETSYFIPSTPAADSARSLLVIFESLLVLGVLLVSWTFFHFYSLRGKYLSEWIQHVESGNKIPYTLHQLLRGKRPIQIQEDYPYRKSSTK